MLAEKIQTRSVEQLKRYGKPINDPPDDLFKGQWRIIFCQFRHKFGLLGILPFALSTLFLGLGYGWIAYRTGSVRWVAFSHGLGGILSLGGLIAPSILALLA